MSIPKYMVHFVSIKHNNMHIPLYPRVDQPCTIRKTLNVCQIVLGDYLNGEKYCPKESTHLSYSHANKKRPP